MKSGRLHKSGSKTFDARKLSHTVSGFVDYPLHDIKMRKSNTFRINLNENKTGYRYEKYILLGNPRNDKLLRIMTRL